MFLIKSILIISTLNESTDIRVVQKFSSSLKKNYKVKVMCTKNVRTENADLDEELFIYHGRPKSITERIILLIKIIKFVNSNNFDAIQISNAELVGILPFIKVKNRPKIIFDMHEDFEAAIIDKHWIPKYLRRGISNFYKHYLNFSLKNWIDLCIVTTPLIKNKVDKYGNVVVIENYAPYIPKLPDEVLTPPEIQSSIDNNNRSVKLIFTGLINKHRGVLEVIKALKGNPNVVFYMVGIYSDSIKGEIDDLVKRLDLNERVKLFDSVSYNQMIAIMRQMDIGILPYLPYGNHMVTRPNKLFEYMMTSLPVISSNFPLYEEVVLDGVGISINPLDNDAMTNAIQQLANSQIIRIKMGKKGKLLYMKKYNWQIEEKKVFKIYYTLLGE